MPFTAIDQRLGLLTGAAIQRAVGEHIHNVGGGVGRSFPGATKPSGVEPTEFLADAFAKGGDYLSRTIQRHAPDEMEAA